MGRFSLQLIKDIRKINLELKLINSLASINEKNEIIYERGIMSDEECDMLLEIFDRHNYILSISRNKNGALTIWRNDV